MPSPNCPMPPGLPADAQSELLNNARDVAKIIFEDMHKLSCLSDQQSKLRCGDLLQKALPLGTLDSEGDGMPVFLTELLPFEGDYSSFSSLLRVSTAVGEQKRQAVAVTQASGSGKTKLAYAHGLEQGLMVLIRVVEQHSEDEKEINLSGPWTAFLQLCDDLMASVSPSNKLAYAQSALTALRLVAVAYVLWVTMVLQEYASISMPGSENRKAPTIDSPLAARYREAALRCLRNGRGDDAVAKIYSKLLVAFKDPSSPSTAGGFPRPVMDGVKEYLQALNTHLSSELLWPQAEIALWYDEAQMLLERGRVFMSLTEVNNVTFGGSPDTIATPSTADDAGKTSNALAGPKDAMYGLTALMRWLTNKVGWGQVICGPWLELSNRVKLPEISCLNGGLAPLHHASRITLTDMTRSINRFFKVELTKPIRKLLAKLVGRPKWFFDNFWPSLWVKLRDYWVSRATPLSALTPALVEEFIKQSAIQAVAASTTAATRLIDARWSDKLEGEDGVPSSSALCRELYAAIKMNLGRVKVSGGGATAAAVRYGLLALEPDDAGTDAILSQEPTVATALEEYGDNMVAEASKLKKLDPVEVLLKRKISDGEIAQFDMTTSIKGPVFELCFVWHVIKTRLVREAAPTLEQIFKGLLPLTFRLPNNAAILVATASKAVSSKTIREISNIKTDYHVFFEGEHTDYLIYNLDRFAGMDIGFPAAEDGDLTKRILVSVQLKPQVQPSLVECLRAATPAWQYVQTPLLNALTGNGWPEDKRPVASDKRKHFEALASDLPEFFDRSVRVALTAIEFRPESVAVCNALNVTDCYDSPIVLAAITDDCAFPLAKPVRATVLKEYAASQVAHTEQWQYWLSHSVAEVANGIATAGTVTTTLSDYAAAATATALRKLRKRQREFVPEDPGGTAAKVPRIDGTDDEGEYSSGE